uniref:DEP domain-containing protein n=2 Tax=Octopus bimaculoides TaxID=37653 RepID=A0A0L8FYL9_OCTBM
MEQLVKQMSDPNNGIQVRTQKQFLTTIPKAFTGSDLIDWLMKKLDITELNEVYHLASLLCHYGYIFPITDTKSLSVKEDGSLYRFQCPYYWPQSDMSADNEAYGKFFLLTEIFLFFYWFYPFTVAMLGHVF